MDLETLRTRLRTERIVSREPSARVSTQIVRTLITANLPPEEKASREAAAAEKEMSVIERAVSLVEVPKASPTTWIVVGVLGVGALGYFLYSLRKP